MFENVLRGHKQGTQVEQSGEELDKEIYEEEKNFMREIVASQAEGGYKKHKPPALPFASSPSRSSSPESPLSPRARFPHRAQAQPRTRSPRREIAEADLDPQDIEPRSPSYLIPGRRDRVARSVSPYPQTHRDSWLAPSNLRDAEMNDHFFAKYGAQEARQLDAERRARSTSREWRNATSGLARKGYRQDSPSSSSPRFKQTSPSPKRENNIEQERPWATMACKRLGKKEWAHAANKMLVSLLQELDLECSTHQEDWTRDRDHLTRQVALYQNQLVAIQRVLYRVQNKELEKSKK